MRWLNSVTIPMDMNLSIFQEIIEDRGAWHTAVHLVVKVGYKLVTENKIMETKDTWQESEIHRLCSMGPWLNKPRDFLQPAYC